MSRRIAIIGGGASGMMAAITALLKGAEVDIFEANEDLGKKILASGNGRCNISNKDVSVDHYAGSDPAFASYALEHFSFTQAQNFFKNLGLFWEIKTDGKAYPLSNEAKSVVLTLKSAALQNGAKFYTSTLIETIEKEDTFTLKSHDKVFTPYDRVLIATGSQAAPQLGSNTSGYQLAQAFSHTVIDPYPSLVQLELESNLHAKLNGVKLFAKVGLILDGTLHSSVEGDILFTRYGISGFAILDLSQKASLALIQEYQVGLTLNLLPQFDRQTLSNILVQECKEHPQYPFTTLLSGLLSTKIVPYVLEAVGLPLTTPAQNLDTKMVKKIVNLLLDWRYKVVDTHGFKHAEVSGGGINTFEIDPKTMQSRIVDGLFFSGEVLDIVGARGGYNFHFAWASGRLAGFSMVH